MGSVVLATSQEVPGLLDEEGELLREALVARGVDAAPGIWDDPARDWSGPDLVVVRSTWDYATRRDEFLGWADRVGRLLNPAPMIAWNTDKHYLADLAAHGLPVVPSHVVEPGQDAAHPLLGTEHVVKPCVSAGSKDTLRLGVGDDDRSVAHTRALLDAGRSVLVQPYLDGVDTQGETALVYVDGAFSHAVRKAAILVRGNDPVHGLFAPEEICAREPGPDERAVGDRVLAAVLARYGPAPLYARVDLLPAPDGPVLLELELTEPSLFLQYAPGAADALAEAIVARLVAGSTGGAGPR